MTDAIKEGLSERKMDKDKASKEAEDKAEAPATEETVEEASAEKSIDINFQYTEEMAKITASEVNRLRQMTGSGMMDCKNALVEAEGDFDKAIEILRKKGQKVAAKRGDREANEGLIISVADDSGKKGVITSLTCETDFVAKNADFNDVANKIANIALTSGVKTIDELKAQSFDGNGLTIGDKVLEMVGKIGEKIDVTNFRHH